MYRSGECSMSASTFAGVRPEALESTATGNIVFNNAREYVRAATGIRIYQSPDNIVDHNVSHDNEDTGLEAYAGSNNTLFYDNVMPDGSPDRRLPLRCGGV